MKLITPPKIFWRIRGPVSNDEQKRLQAEACRQTRLLTGGMAFQGLSQGRRSAVRGGYRFRCVSVFGLQCVTIELHGKDTAKRAKRKQEDCWCSCQFTSGQVMGIINAGVGPNACVPINSCETYPDCACDDISAFEGLRYIVKVCQMLPENGFRQAATRNFICVPTDFEEFTVGDLVFVLYLDSWIPSECSGDGGLACNVPNRDTSLDTIIYALDGQFLVLPYER